MDYKNIIKKIRQFTSRWVFLPVKKIKYRLSFFFVLALQNTARFLETRKCASFFSTGFVLPFLLFSCRLLFQINKDTFLLGTFAVSQRWSLYFILFFFLPTCCPFFVCFFFLKDKKECFFRGREEASRG